MRTIPLFFHGLRARRYMLPRRKLPCLHLKMEKPRSGWLSTRAAPVQSLRMLPASIRSTVSPAASAAFSWVTSRTAVP